MSEAVSAFYDELAESYHLIFKDWNASMARQGEVFGRLLESELGGGPLAILDCACGIGTQALGLAGRGHRVMGTDLSGGAIARARREALSRGLAMWFAVADMRELGALAESGFDAVLASDNALPHLPGESDLQRAADSIHTKLRSGGLFLATIRDYDQMVRERPTAESPAFSLDEGRRRIVHQVWDWVDERSYRVHLYITRETDAGWQCGHYVSIYRAVLREELTGILASAGFAEVRWLMPAESGLYQPLVMARG